MLHLPSLAMACTLFGQDQICMWFFVSFLLFGHPVQVSDKLRDAYSLLQQHLIQDMTKPVGLGFVQLLCTCEETWEYPWPSNGSLCASFTYGDSQLLAGPFGQDLTLNEAVMYGV